MIRLTPVTSAQSRARVSAMQHVLFPVPANYHADLMEGQWWIAQSAGRDAGFCAIAPLKHSRECAYLSRAGVMPNYRGKGLQQRMIRLRLRWAKSKGYRYVVTYTEPSNLASSNSLISCGFKLYRPSKPLSAPGMLHWRTKI